MTKLANYQVEYFKFLDENGKLLQELPKQINNLALAVEAYKAMVLGRAFDKKAVALQRTGQMGTYPSILGQEAIGAAIGLIMHEEDIFTPYYRDLITQVLRGVNLSEVLLYWGGDERGSAFSQCTKDFPNCVPIATQCGHAAGAAVALKSQGIHQAVVVTCGEGATSKGDFLESLNLAGAWHLPLVMLVNNNQWAISTPRSQQTAAETIAQKGALAGVEGIQVDGNDFFAIAYAVKRSLAKAYAGKGPTLIEAVTYRLGDHTTADDASRYRSDEELKSAWQREPISRLERFLTAHGEWDEQKESLLQNEVNTKIDNAVKTYLATKKELPESMFDYLYEQLPAPLNDQYAQAKFGRISSQGG